MTGLDEYARSRLTRSGTDRLPAHLEAGYGIGVAAVSPLDLGVFRVDRRDGPSWVARVFPAARPAGAAAGDAGILDFLAGAGFPAERCAAPEPVSVLDGQEVLVTGYVEAVPRSSLVETIRRLGGFVRLGAMLGRLQTFPEAARRPGGAWHHLADGAPREEIAAAAALLDAAAGLAGPGDRGAYEELRAAVADFDGGDGLPEALVHPDFLLANAIASADDRLVMVDWTGAGLGPRLWPLAFLLYSAGARRMELVRSVVRGYTRAVRPEPEELARLARIMRVRPSVLEVWAFCTGRKPVADAARSVAEIRVLCDAIAARAADEFQSG
jgi:Ser/Thr protein kinase RdoA (MazF antagonist)